LHRLSLPTGVRRQQQQPQSQQYTINEDDPSNNKIDDNANGDDDAIHCQVYLLGTAHVSKDSCADAKLLMEYMKPDVLFVELCNQRIALLEDDDDDDNRQNTPVNPNVNDDSTPTAINDTDNQSIRQMYQTALQSNPNLTKTAALSSVLLSKIQGDYASKLGVSIGGEFREAYKVAKAQQQSFDESLRKLRWETLYGVDSGVVRKGEEEALRGRCTVVLGDRPVQLTLNRAYESLTFIGRMKLVLGLFWSCFQQPDINELKEWIDQIMNDPNSDVLTKSIQELSRHFPTIEQTIIAERDTYMACKLLQTARVLAAATAEDGKPRTIVAIVGAGHCPGIVEQIRWVGEDPSSRIRVMIDGLRDVVETKKMKVEESEELKFCVEEVASL